MASVLSQSDALRFLISKQLIPAQSVAFENVAVTDVSRRNRNMKVTTAGGAGYLLKQGRGPHEREAVAWEATVYRLLHSLCDGRLRRCLVRLHAFDPGPAVAVLQLLPTARTLREHYRRVGRCASRIGTMLGAALASLHDLQVPEDVIQSSPRAYSAPPWVLAIHRPHLRIFRYASAASLQLVAIVQSFPAFGDALDRLGEEWRSDALIHFDLKSDNCLITEPDSPQKSELSIIDWELARIGDVSWDVGSVFADYLGLWVLSIPLTTDMSTVDAADLAQLALDGLHRPIGSFWHSYVRNRRRLSEDYGVLLTRSVQYAAARLVQSADEQIQTAQQFTGTAVLLLQVSMNMLLAPREAAVHLLGLPLDARASRAFS